MNKLIAILLPLLLLFTSTTLSQTEYYTDGNQKYEVGEPTTVYIEPSVYEVQCRGGGCVPRSPSPKNQHLGYISGETKLDVNNYKQVVRVEVIESQSQGRTHASLGTGVIVGVDTSKKQAYVLTCWHNFRGWSNGGQIYAYVAGRKLPATLIQRTQREDLAIIAIADIGINPIRIAGAVPRVGARVFCLGYGLGKTVLTRILGPFRRSVLLNGGVNSIIWGHQIPQGYSGGPVIDENGQLVGIMWGTNDDEGFGTSIIEIRKVFGVYLIERKGDEWRPSNPGIPSNPNIPIPSDPDIPIPPEKPSGCIDDIKILKDKVSQLEKDLAGAKNSINLHYEHIQTIEQSVSIDEVLDRIKPTLDNMQSQINGLKKQIAEIELMPGTQGPKGDPGNNATVDIDDIVGRVLTRIGEQSSETPDAQTQHERLLYFCVEGATSCIKTDKLARELKDRGYPINIITLKPNETSVKSVPRIFEVDSGEEYLGVSNVVTYFSSLTF